MGQLVGGTILEGGVLMSDAIPRVTNPFGSIRRANVAGTLQAVIDDAVAGDVIYIDPGTYDENIVVATAGLTLVGVGARGQPWINPATGVGLQIDTVDDIVIVNLGIAGDGSPAAALRLTSTSESRFYGCKFEGSADVLVLLEGSDTAQCANLMFFDCEFAWGTVGMEFDNSSYGYPTQILVRRCFFHDVTTAHMRDEAAGGAAKDLWVEDCRFMNSEDGTEPTDYIILDHVDNTGFFSGNYFAAATITAAKMTIDAGIIWVGNYAENGLSAARP